MSSGGPQNEDSGQQHASSVAETNGTTSPTLSMASTEAYRAGGATPQQQQPQQQSQAQQQSQPTQPQPRMVRATPPTMPQQANSAVLYLDDVKREFLDKPDIYNEFLAVMKDFKSGGLDTVGVRTRVIELFRGRKKILTGFNAFLPPNCAITEQDMEDIQRPSVDQRSSMLIGSPAMSGARHLSTSGAPRSVTTLPPPPSTATIGMPYAAMPLTMDYEGHYPGEAMMSSFRGSIPSNVLEQQQQQQQQQQAASSMHPGPFGVAAGGSRVSTSMGAQPLMKGVTTSPTSSPAPTTTTTGGAAPSNRGAPSSTSLMSGAYGGGGSGAAGSLWPPPMGSATMNAHFPGSHPSTAAASMTAYGGTSTGYGNPPGSYVYQGPSSMAAASFHATGMSGHATLPHQSFMLDSRLGSSRPPSSAIPTATAAAAPTAEQTNPEFTKAVDFVRRVRARFSNRPKIYEEFLETLRGGSADQLSKLSPEEIDVRVRTLFKDHPDLLRDFRMFMPSFDERVYLGGVGNRSFAAQGVPPPGFAPPLSVPATAESFMPVRKPSLSSQKAAAAAATTTTTAKSKKPTMLSSSWPIKTVRPHEMETRPIRKLEEEMDFFESVRKRLNNKLAYTEFLRCLNLYSNEIISRQELIQLAHGFLGKHADLFDWFKRFVGFREGIERREKLQERPPEINYSSCKRYGPSYRALPKAYQYMTCTGRDEVCNEVLNDVWVSFPTWSEDSVFLSSKKNVYEEALYKCEDERYEMDRIIEANMATIKVLEAASSKMAHMTGDELNRYRLNNSLNGTSECIYAAAMRRVYGDRAPELLESLKRNPAITVPVVLQRLKQKDEEWHRIKREWIKIWSEIHEKNYYKALDHQALNFKTNDKKSLTMKSLISEIEAVLSEQRARHADTYGQPEINDYPVHLEYHFRKTAVFEESAKVLRLFLLKGSSFSHNEKEKIESLFHLFVMTAFGVTLNGEGRLAKPITGPGASLGVAVNPPADSIAEIPVSSATAGSADASKAATDPARQSTAELPTAVATVARPVVTGPAEIMTDGPDLNALRPTLVSDDGNDPIPAASLPHGLATTATTKNAPSVWIAFVNNSLYVLIRAVQSLYSRIAKIQSIAEKMARSPEKYRRTSSLALKLGIQRDMLPHITETQYYNELFSTLDKFFAGELDQTAFEDQIRFMFGTSAYVLFTIDKLFMSLCRLTLNVASDEKSLQLLDLWQKYTNDQKALPAGQTNNRDAVVERYYDVADRIVGSEYLYRVSYEPRERRLGVRLLDRGATSPESLRSLKERWVDYVDDYVKLDLTAKEFLPKRPVLLSRTLPRPPIDVSSIMEQTVIRNNLECKICVNTYRMFFVENTYDSLYRCRPARPASPDKLLRETRARRRFDKFHQWWSTTRHNETLFGDVTDANAKCDRWFTRGEGLLSLRRFVTRIESLPAHRFMDDDDNEVGDSRISGFAAAHSPRVYRTEFEDDDLGVEPDTDQLMNASDLAIDDVQPREPSEDNDDDNDRDDNNANDPAMVEDNNNNDVGDNIDNDDGNNNDDSAMVDDTISSIPSED